MVPNYYASIVNPFIWCQDSLWRGGSSPSSRSISSPASSIHRLLSPLRLVLIERPRHRMRDWYLSRTWRAETLLSMSLRISAGVHAFLLASQAFGLGMVLRRAAESPSSLVGVVRGQRGVCMRRPSYLLYSLMGPLRKHPRTV